MTRATAQKTYLYLQHQAFSQALCDAWDGKTLTAAPTDLGYAQELVIEALGIASNWPGSPGRLESLREHGFVV